MITTLGSWNFSQQDNCLGLIPYFVFIPPLWICNLADKCHVCDKYCFPSISHILIQLLELNVSGSFGAYTENRSLKAL